MKRLPHCFRLILLAVGAGVGGAWAAASANPVGDASAWVVEQMPGGTCTFARDELVIDDLAGCTVWWRQRLAAPLVIRYEATVVSAGGPHDRVSDLNCFWMARDPARDQLLAPGHGRRGKFEDYDALQTYYVGQGGNENTTTRFRRYAGDGTKPLHPEHDLRDARFLLEANRPYRVELSVSADGVVRYRRDDVLIFEFRDPAPLLSGWFGLRTVHSHLRIRQLEVESSAAAAP